MHLIIEIIFFYHILKQNLGGFMEYEEQKINYKKDIFYFNTKKPLKKSYFNKVFNSQYRLLLLPLFIAFLYLLKLPYAANDIISTISYIAGAGIGFKWALLMKEHTEPHQTDWSKILLLSFASGLLLSFPALFNVSDSNSSFAQSANTHQQLKLLKASYEK